MKAVREPLILAALKKYAEGNPARFHMPGHKGSREYSSLFPGAEYDITELSFSGCLTSGEGVVAEAERNIAEILGASFSHIVTDGSSAAVLAMMYALSKRGEKVIIPRNSHKSVYNALKLFNLCPLFLECEQRDGIMLQSVQSAECLLRQEDVSGMLLVSPDYFGQVPDLALARALTAGCGKILAVDGAHGGHLKFCRPEIYAGGFADVWVDGIHKTMPCLTQASLLNVADASLEDDVAEGLSLFRTTSPSYPIMASAEYGVYFAEAEGGERLKVLFAEAERLKAEAERIGYAVILPADGAKLLIDCEASAVSCADLCAFLEGKGVFCEFADERYVVLMISAHTEKEQLCRLLAVLGEYRDKCGKVPYFPQKQQIICKACRKMEYYEAANAPFEYVSAERAVGRIAADNAGVFPPCYPVITAGEQITAEVVEILKKSKNTYGLRGDCFKAVKD